MKTPSVICRRMLSLVASAVAMATLLALPSTALAQGAKAGTPTTTSTTSTGDYSENRTDGSSVVVFKEDGVGGGGANAFGGTILRPPGATRVGLLRPRFNFVSEMLKSVETL